jgi:hypothetical protein
VKGRSTLRGHKGSIDAMNGTGFCNHEEIIPLARLKHEVRNFCTSFQANTGVVP